MSVEEMATTFLFVPGDRPERFDRACASGADVVVIDLEDGVAPDRKAAARDAIRRWRTQVPASVIVRISPLGTPEAADDLAMLTSLPTRVSVVVSKAESPAGLASLGQRLSGASVLALIETAAGIAVVRELAQAPGVRRLIFGHLDYAADLDVPATGPLMTHARCEIVVASRAAGLAPPIDGVTTELDDMDAVLRDARAARALGFGGKLCLNPRQVAPVADAFAPAEGEVTWARRVLDAAEKAGDGAVRVGTEMIDAPVLKRARAVLARSNHG